MVKKQQKNNCYFNSITSKFLILSLIISNLTIVFFLWNPIFPQAPGFINNRLLSESFIILSMWLWPQTITSGLFFLINSRVFLLYLGGIPAIWINKNLSLLIFIVKNSGTSLLIISSSIFPYTALIFLKFSNYQYKI